MDIRYTSKKQSNFFFSKIIKYNCLKTIFCFAFAFGVVSMQSYMLKEDNTMELKQLLMFGHQKFNKQMNLASHRSGFLEELLGKILIVLKLVGRFVKMFIVSLISYPFFFLRTKRFWLYVQVSPDLYGDNNTRLFTYWTVSYYYFLNFKILWAFFFFLFFFFFIIDFNLFCV